MALLIENAQRRHYKPFRRGTLPIAWQRSQFSSHLSIYPENSALSRSRTDHSGLRAEENGTIPDLHGCILLSRIHLYRCRAPAPWPLCRSNQKGKHVQVLVRDNNVDQALRVLKKKMQREGVFREMKLRKHYEKPSERKTREKAEAVRRARKLARKKLQREGLLPMKPRVVPGTVRSGRPSRVPRF